MNLLPVDIIYWTSIIVLAYLEITGETEAAFPLTMVSMVGFTETYLLNGNTK